MKKFFNKTRILVLAAAFLLIPLVAFAINTVDTGYQVLDGTTVQIDAHGTCKKVTNSTANDYFVPTKTSTEWSTFRSNLPTNVTLAACAVDCATPVFGYSCSGNWLAGDVSSHTAASCETWCDLYATLYTSAGCCAYTNGQDYNCQLYDGSAQAGSGYAADCS